MGGRFGDGPVVPEPEDVKFHADWHPRALAVTLAAGMLGKWNIDTSRFARESLAPKDYARFSYYEKWMSALADLLVEKGMVTREELSGEAPVARSTLSGTPVTPARVRAAIASGGPADRPTEATPDFAPGDAVMTRRITANRLVDGGHTRLPRYAAGAKGRVLRYHGAHIFPDSNAHGLGEAPEPLYAVAFPAKELWAAPENPADEVVLDLWQSYLEPDR